MTATAKLFWSGRSQAVRLPKEFRFDATEVKIRRNGEQVILERAGHKETDAEWAERLAGSLDEDFARAVLEDRPTAADLPDGPSFD